MPLDKKDARPYLKEIDSIIEKILDGFTQWFILNTHAQYIIVYGTIPAGSKGTVEG